MPKKKIKIWKVDECFQCQAFSQILNQHTKEVEQWCDEKEKKHMDINGPYGIPKWCPLEDYQK